MSYNHEKTLSDLRDFAFQQRTHSHTKYVCVLPACEYDALTQYLSTLAMLPDYQGVNLTDSKDFMYYGVQVKRSTT
jgi:hypothetical protein